MGVYAARNFSFGWANILGQCPATRVSGRLHLVQRFAESAATASDNVKANGVYRRFHLSLLLQRRMMMVNAGPGDGFGGSTLEGSQVAPEPPHSAGDGPVSTSTMVALPWQE